MLTRVLVYAAANKEIVAIYPVGVLVLNYLSEEDLPMLQKIITILNT